MIKKKNEDFTDRYTESKNSDAIDVTYNPTQQVLFAPVLPQLGQPFVPSSLSRKGSACFQKFLPKVNEQSNISLSSQIWVQLHVIMQIKYTTPIKLIVPINLI